MKKCTAHQHQSFIPTVKHGGWSIMVEHCFVASGSEYFEITEGTMISNMYQDILLENVRTAVHDFKLKGG